MDITSTKNQKIKLIKKLRDRRDIDKTGLFLIEGYRELFRANAAHVEIKTLFFCEDLFLKDNEYSLIEKIKKNGAEIISLKKNIFEKISYRDRPDGLLAIASQKRLYLQELNKIIKKSKNPFFIVAQHIEKPGNLGTILRSSDGVGVDAAIVCDPCTDLFNPNVIRASIGCLFTKPVIEADTNELIKFFKKNNIKIIATTPNSKTIYFSANLSQPIAIVVGTEQYGLSEKWLKNADIKVKIPMIGVADSLNVGAATTILLYETLRQRNNS